MPGLSQLIERALAGAPRIAAASARIAAAQRTDSPCRRRAGRTGRPRGAVPAPAAVGQRPAAYGIPRIQLVQPVGPGPRPCATSSTGGAASAPASMPRWTGPAPSARSSAPPKWHCRLRWPTNTSAGRPTPSLIELAGQRLALIAEQRRLTERRIGARLEPADALRANRPAAGRCRRNPCAAPSVAAAAGGRAMRIAGHRRGRPARAHAARPAPRRNPACLRRRESICWPIDPMSPPAAGASRLPPAKPM